MTIAASVQSYLNRDGVRYEMITHERTRTAITAHTRRAHSGWPTGEMHHAAVQPGIPDGRASCHAQRSPSQLMDTTAARGCRKSLRISRGRSSLKRR